MDFTTDAVVVGAGVVGLAVARALAQSGLETVVLERNRQIGEESSSRNSEVIHAGIYYPQGSLKAKTCVRGKVLLYRFLESHGVPHRRCGKLVVAPAEQGIRQLLAIRQRANQCGVTDLALLDAAAVRELEPAVRGEAGLFSPSTGIVDSHQLMLALRGDLEAAGGVVALASPVEGGRLSDSGRHVVRAGGSAPSEIGCQILVNASGLHAREVWHALLKGEPPALVPPQYFAKGHYYSYSGRSPFSRLVYPLPEPGGLGVHATLDIGGQVRFGPDVRWVKHVDYSFDDSCREQFVAAIETYYPSLERERLQPGYTGIRSKISAPDEPAADFAILGSGQHGIPGFCSLHGIESPGLTACLAIAENVVESVLSGFTKRRT